MQATLKDKIKIVKRTPPPSTRWGRKVCGPLSRRVHRGEVRILGSKWARKTVVQPLALGPLLSRLSYRESTLKVLCLSTPTAVIAVSIGICLLRGLQRQRKLLKYFNLLKVGYDSDLIV